MGATPTGDSDPAYTVAHLDQVKARADDAFAVILDDVKARLERGQDPIVVWHATWTDLASGLSPFDKPGEHAEWISFLACVAATFAMRVAQD